VRERPAQGRKTVPLRALHHGIQLRPADGPGGYNQNVQMSSTLTTSRF